MKITKKRLSYKVYLLECLFQTIDDKIDNCPQNFHLFAKKLKNVKNRDIIEEKKQE